jgi:hypothetical protein
MIESVCPVCQSKFVKNTHNKIYCGAKCAYDNGWRHRSGKRAVYKCTPWKQSVWSQSKRIYCPELKRTFKSIRAASRLIGIGQSTIYGNLRGLHVNALGLSFVEYDPDKHPFPR